MDTKDFTLAEAIEKINHAMKPHVLKFKETVWFSQFSVKEAVAESFFIQDRVFLAGDACHIHSVNGGQGLNTGLADAFNLIWKLNMVENFGASRKLLETYEEERKPVALSVVETSGELVRSTKHSDAGTHAQDYIQIVQKRAGNITGMGIRYGDHGPRGSRLFDSEVMDGAKQTRLYSLLDYAHYTLLIFGGGDINFKVPKYVKIVQIHPTPQVKGLWVENSFYSNQAVLVRPDSYLASVIPIDQFDPAQLCQF